MYIKLRLLELENITLKTKDYIFHRINPGFRIGKFYISGT